MPISGESLNTNFLTLILERLPITDYLRFAAVCPSWDALQHNHRNSHVPSPRYTRQMPWLIALGEDTESPRDGISPCRHKIPAYNPSEHRYYQLEAPLTVGCEGFYCGGCHGWTLWVKNKALLIVNLLTGVQIQVPLPPLEELADDEPMGLLSSAPTDPTCIVYLFLTRDRLLTCHISDKSWTEMSPWNDLPSESFPDFFLDEGGHPAICKGKCYLYSSDLGMLFVMNPFSVPTVTSLNMKYLSQSRDYVPELELEYLVESEGQLLLVKFYKENKSIDIRRFEVFKADLKLQAWVMIESLQDRVLFLCWPQSFSMSAADAGCHCGRIYLATLDTSSEEEDQYQFGEKTWIEYDYESKEMVQDGTADTFLGLGFHWMTPTL